MSRTGGEKSCRKVITVEFKLELQEEMSKEYIIYNVKLNLLLCLIKHHALKAQGGVKLHLDALFFSALEKSSQLHTPLLYPRRIRGEEKTLLYVPRIEIMFLYIYTQNVQQYATLVS
jgi:hypothetical protein